MKANSKGPAKTGEAPEALVAYLDRISRFQLMNQRDEAALGSRVRDGDLRARHEFIERNLRLVIFVAGKYRDRGMPMEDLIQEGNLGLIRATDKFDPGRGNRFSSYAVWWIREAISKALADKGRAVRLPVHVVDKIYKMTAARESLSSKLGREPDYGEVAGRLGWLTEEVRTTAKLVPNAASLNRPIGAAGEPGEMGDLIEDEAASEASEMALREVDAERFSAAVRLLPDRHQRVLVRRYGLDGHEPATLAELAAQLELSRARVSELQREAERALKYRGARLRASNRRNGPALAAAPRRGNRVLEV